MQKFIAFALSAFSASAASVESPRLSCLFAKEWMIFDYTPLEAATDYVHEDLQFNFCKFAEWPRTESTHIYTFAYELDSKDDPRALTSDNVFP
jgi:hypothetical protein